MHQRSICFNITASSHRRLASRLTPWLTVLSDHKWQAWANVRGPRRNLLHFVCWRHSPIYWQVSWEWRDICTDRISVIPPPTGSGHEARTGCRVETWTDARTRPFLSLCLQRSSSSSTHTIFHIKQSLHLYLCITFGVDGALRYFEREAPPTGDWLQLNKPYRSAEWSIWINQIKVFLK